MSLLALLTTTPVDPDPDPPGDLPTAPYNAAAPMTYTTYDGSGQAVHPGVLDFGETGWGGHRYWMAYTPYPNSNASMENPCIAWSDDATTWTEPSGVNPIDPDPPGPDYNSDTDLVHDPDTDLLWIYYRHYVPADGRAYIKATSSADGEAWSSPTVVLSLASGQASLSPAVLRVGPGDWRMWLLRLGGGHVVRTATAPTGPWSAPSAVTIPTLSGNPWHSDVVKDPASGDFHMILNNRNPWCFHAVRSSDGLTWTSPDGTPFLVGRTGEWDESRYRASMTLEPGGHVYQVWYSAFKGSTWNIGHTRVPRAHWTG